MKQEFDVTGMTCAACSARVEKCVTSLPSTENVTVNLLTNRMKLEWDENQLSEQEIIDAVENAGYHAQVRNQNGVQASTAVREDPVKQQMEKKKRELTISVCFLIPLMYLAMHSMLESWLHIPVPQFIHNAFDGPENAVVFTLAQFFILLPILYCNRDYFTIGWKALWHRSPNMDTLIALGASASVVYGIVILFVLAYGAGHGRIDLIEQYHMEIYLESAGTILTLITVGKYLESKAKGKTSEALEKLMDYAPRTAFVVRNGVEVEVAVNEVQAGETFLVKPGSSIPVDGVVLEGSSSVDESAMTGESIPAVKNAGDSLISATINGNGFLRAKATRVGEDTTFQQILHFVEDASSSKAPIAKIADRVAGVFVPAVMGISLVAMIIWLVSGATLSFALSIGIAILVISCPCALGLATPVAIMVGIGKGAEQNIFIKSGEALEIAHEVDTVVLDKTGTITQGVPEVTDVAAYHLKETEFLQMAVALEKSSQHPLAEAIVRYGKQKLGEEKVQELTVENFQSFPGLGISAGVHGTVCYSGNEKFIEQQKITIDKNTKKQMDQWADEGKTPLLFAAGNHVIGIIAAADQEKETSREAIQQMQDMGLHVIMMTGDNPKTAEAVRRRMGIQQVFAGVLPQDKEGKIAQMQKEGHKVAMIGDGINDAPALVKADVGMAIGAGTDIAVESADIVFMKNDLRDVVTAIQLSKAVIRNIHQNLFWAFFYNSLGIPLAAGVLYPAFGIKLSPMIGAAAMSLSSFCVVSNALRLKWFHSSRKYQNEEKTQVQQAAVQPQNEKVQKPKEEKIMGKEVTMEIEGMMCGHCEMHVQKALGAIDGVQIKEVSHEKKKADVVLSKDVTDEQLKAAVEDAGYEVLNIKR